MKFLIQHNLMNEKQLLKVKGAVTGFPHQFVGLIPFSREVTVDDSQPLSGVDYIPYGSTLFSNIGHELGWRGLHFDLQRFTYTEAIKHRSDMLNNGLIMTAEEAIRSFETGLLGEDMTWFIRPDQDLKQFSGYVAPAHEIKDHLFSMVKSFKDGFPGTYSMNPETKVVFSTVKEIKAEWRWFIVNGNIVSGSMYRAHGQMRQIRETDQSVIDEAQKLTNIWLPDDCVVMDTALVGDEVKVIEFNCINSSGFYDNDVNEIFKALWEFHR